MATARNPMNDLVLETERLVLRRMSMEDVPAMRLIHSDAELMWVYGGVFDEEGTRAWIQRNIDRYRNAPLGLGFWAITLKNSGEVIGGGGCVWQETDRGVELEVGYQIRRDQWRRGYATEMARACIDYGFAMTDVDHIISLIRPDNVASRRVAEKNGLVVDREFDWKGTPHLVYVMTREHWMNKAI
jgi:[ribosomal protein S5]-alanine N-acetyltransferase